jgi:hypothetical protein
MRDMRLWMVFELGVNTGETVVGFWDKRGKIGVDIVTYNASLHGLDIDERKRSSNRAFSISTKTPS